MTVRSLLRSLRPPERRATIRVLIVALVIAGICFYFGTDVWHAIVLGSVITTLGVIGRVGAAVDVSETSWRSDGWTNRKGSRSDVAELSRSLRERYGRVGSQAVWRVQRLARQRLALHHLDLQNPADRRQIQRLIGRRPYAVLRRGNRRPPLLRSLLRCLDALDALDPMRPVAPEASSPRRQPSFRSRRPRRTRER